MSARNSVTGPGRPPDSVATTPVPATPVRISATPAARSSRSMKAAVPTSRSESSGCACRWRRYRTNSSCGVCGRTSSAIGAVPSTAHDDPPPQRMRSARVGGLLLVQAVEEIEERRIFLLDARAQCTRKGGPFLKKLRRTPDDRPGLHPAGIEGLEGFGQPAPRVTQASRHVSYGRIVMPKQGRIEVFVLKPQVRANDARKTDQRRAHDGLVERLGGGRNVLQQRTQHAVLLAVDPRPHHPHPPGNQARIGPATRSSCRSSTPRRESPARRAIIGIVTAKAPKSAARMRAPAFDRAGLTDDQLVAILRTMLLQRGLENRGFQLNRQGKIPFASASEGHEAVQAGAAMAFARGSDILVPYYRDLGLALGIGLTPLEVMLSLFARAADHCGGRQFPHHYATRRLGIQTISSVIAAQLPHAVGAAYALRLRRASGRAVL